MSLRFAKRKMTKLQAKTQTKEWLQKRDQYLQRTYGITIAQYNKKLREQEHSCWICRKHKSQFKSSLAVDHNHKTGAVRGLVCYRCNKFVIGRHNLDSARTLYRYMLKFEGEGESEGENDNE